MKRDRTDLAVWIGATVITAAFAGIAYLRWKVPIAILAEILDAKR